MEEAAVILSAISLASSFYACVQIEAMKRSTHKVVMYNPLSGKSDPLGEEDFSGPLSDELKKRLQSEGEFEPL